MCPDTDAKYLFTDGNQSFDSRGWTSRSVNAEIAMVRVKRKRKGRKKKKKIWTIKSESRRGIKGERGGKKAGELKRLDPIRKMFHLYEIRPHSGDPHPVDVTDALGDVTPQRHCTGSWPG